MAGDGYGAQRSHGLLARTGSAHLGWILYIRWILADPQPYLDICTQACRLRTCRLQGSQSSPDSVPTPSRSLRTWGWPREVARADEDAAYRAPAAPPLVDLPAPGSIHPADVGTAANVETVLDAGPAPILMYPSTALETPAVPLLDVLAHVEAELRPHNGVPWAGMVRDEALPPTTNARALPPSAAPAQRPRLCRRG